MAARAARLLTSFKASAVGYPNFDAAEFGILDFRKAEEVVGRVVAAEDLLNLPLLSAIRERGDSFENLIVKIGHAD